MMGGDAQDTKGDTEAPHSHSLQSLLCHPLLLLEVFGASPVLSLGLSFSSVHQHGQLPEYWHLSAPCCLSRLNRKWKEKIPNPSKSQLFQVGSGCAGG